MQFKIFLSFIMVLTLIVPHVVSARPSTKDKINKTIQLYISESVVSCQRQGLLKSVKFFEKNWKQKKSFEITYFNQNNEPKTEDDISWRSIVVTAHPKENVVDKNGKLKDAMTRRFLGEANTNHKEVFKGLIKLIHDRCYHQEIYLHEFAHIFGEDHVKISGNIMTEIVYFPSYFNGRQLENMKRIAIGYIL